MQTVLLFSMENHRQTRYFSQTCDPEWNTTMVYENVPPEELSTRYLEVTAWNYSIYDPKHCLGGMLLDLAGNNVSMKGDYCILLCYMCLIHVTKGRILLTLRQ